MVVVGEVEVGEHVPAGGGGGGTDTVGSLPAFSMYFSIVFGPLGLVDDHGHTSLAMVNLAAEDPDGLGVVDENVVDRREWLVTLDWDKSGSNTWASGRCQISSERFARLSESWTL